MCHIWQSRYHFLWKVDRWRALRHEDDIWTNQDSCDKWVILDARNTFHRVTTVEGERLSVIFTLHNIFDRLLPDDWEELRRTEFRVDEIWQGRLINETDENEEEIEECLRIKS